MSVIWWATLKTTPPYYHSLIQRILTRIGKTLHRQNTDNSTLLNQHGQNRSIDEFNIIYANVFLVESEEKKSIIDVSPKNIREHLGMWLKIRIEMSKALVKSK